MTQIVKVPTQATLQRTIAPILTQLSTIQQLIAQLQVEVDDFSDGVDLSEYVKTADIEAQFAALGQALDQLQQSVAGKADVQHTHAISQVEGLTEALASLQSAIASIPTPIDRHPFKAPSSYLFTHFVGTNAGEFSFGTSGGNGASAGLITGSTEGYSRIGSGMVANARGFVNSGLQAMRLGQTVENQVDAFRCRAYLNRIQALNDCSLLQLGFLNSNAGTPSNGVFFQYDAAVSPNWQCVAMDNNVATTIETLIPIDANVNHDFQIVIATGGTEAKFYVDQALVSTISTNIPKTSGREVGVVAAIVRKLGTSTHSLSLDHLGGGVRQSL